MDITQFLKQNPDVQLSRGTFGSEEHFRKWYESYSSKSTAQILKEEQGIYGTKIYYVYLPSQKTLYVAEVPSQEKYVYTTDLAISTAKQISKNIQELKSQGATYVEISQPKYEIKDNKVYVNVDVKGYKIENVAQNTLQQPQQQNFNFLNYVYESAKYQAMYKGLTYDPEKYAFELTIKEMEKRGYRDIITTTEKEIAKEIMPPIPFVREAWEAGVSIANILRGVKDVKIIEERKFELIFPEYYFKGTEMKVPSFTEITEKIESRPVKISSELISAGTNLAIAFSPWILAKIPIPRQEKIPVEIQNAIKENRLVLIETAKLERQLIKNPIFVQTEEFFKTKMATETVKKIEEKKLGIIETFAKVPREKYEIRTIHTPFLDRTTIQHFIVKEETKLKDWFHHPSLGDFKIEKTLPIKYTELTSTQIANVQHNIRKEILQNIHYLGIESKPKKPSTPITQPTSSTSSQTLATQTTQLQTEVIIPQRIKVLETKISPIYEEKTLVLPFVTTKTLTNLQQKQTTKQAYMPIFKSTETLNIFNKEISITIPFQTINLNMRISHKTPELSLTTFKTTTSTATPNTTKIIERATRTPEQNIPKIPIKISLPKLPGIDSKRTREIEKPKQVKMYVEKIRFPSLYSLSYNIKNVNNKIAKEIIRPLKL